MNELEIFLAIACAVIIIVVIVFYVGIRAVVFSIGIGAVKLVDKIIK